MNTSSAKSKANDTEIKETDIVQDEQDKADSWRRANYGNEDSGVSAGAVSIMESETGKGDPGRTPGKAEGVEDPEKRGNA